MRKEPDRVMIYRIPGVLVFCLGLSSAGAGCAGVGDDASPLDAPPRAAQGASGGSSVGSVFGPASDTLAGGGTASELLAYQDAVQGVWGNGLSAEALTRNALIANPRANPVMVTVPLATASYADDGGDLALRYQLRHEPTREVMRYLVACALEQGQSVSYTDTSTGEEFTFDGKIGICPVWGVDQAGPKCQQLVSACMLSLVNAMGRSITVSMRGQAFPEHRPGLLTPAPSVRVVTTTEDGEPIPSFRRCLVDSQGTSRSCGWTAEHVGSCTPGSIVYIATGGAPLTGCSDDPASAAGLPVSDTVLRVCSGIRGCDAGSPEHINQSEVGCNGRAEPALRFVCPSSAYFSLMSGPRTSVRASLATPAGSGAAALQKVRHFSVASRPRPSPPAPPGAISVAEAEFRAAVYPAAEADVFSWREGAFYGNLWGNEPLHPRLKAGMNEVDRNGNFNPAPTPREFSGQAIYQHAFACTGEYWTDHAAYVGERLCAGAEGEIDCVATSVGACDESLLVTDCPPLHKCAVTDGGLVEGDRDFQKCEGGERTWGHPITVFLNHPSDVVRDFPFSPFAPLLPRGLPSPGAQFCP
ncbi:hypothetical protein WME90_23860 [Sorangium sp. So ce375]|uniref:hypothetical protein n=1 Tax=Sorangium sp. So ce375 TaxID=3133306 RepID=UPI003F5BE000